jgi:hypothetical protein
MEKLSSTEQSTSMESKEAAWCEWENIDEGPSKSKVDCEAATSNWRTFKWIKEYNEERWIRWISMDNEWWFRRFDGGPSSQRSIVCRVHEIRNTPPKNTQYPFSNRDSFSYDYSLFPSICQSVMAPVYDSHCSRPYKGALLVAVIILSVVE